MTHEVVDEVTALAGAELEWTISLLDRLVELESVEGSDAIRRCLETVADQLPAGGRLKMPEHQGLPSLVCEWGDAADSERLMFAAHADIVPADGQWATSPFVLTRQGQKLTGRGVSDMKGGLAAFVAALRIASRRGCLENAPVSLVVTGDEEVGSLRGMIPLLRNGEATAAWAVCGEPTDLDVFTGNRGVAWLRVVIEGRGGHAGMAHTLHNPLPVAAKVIQALDQLELVAYDERFDPPKPSLTVTSLQLEGDPVVNTVPDRVVVGIDRRLLPGEDTDEALAQVQGAVDELVRPPFQGHIVADWVQPAYIAANNDPFVGAVQEIVRRTGRPGRLGTDSPADDSSWLGAAGISTVLLGPGHPAQAHTSDETLLVSDIQDAIDIYTRLVLVAEAHQLAPQPQQP